MKILIVSDTHRRDGNLRAIIEKQCPAGRPCRRARSAAPQAHRPPPRPHQRAGVPAEPEGRMNAKKPVGAGTPASLQRDDGLNPHHPEE